VCWEAQFGDFVNGAQAIIDQFIVAAESKWGLQNGLVMLLPHGFEGQGPEHSNAYLDRFLALCAEDNLQVAVPTNPAQYFHLLRRQIQRKFRKPLVLMTPKSLLRYEPSFSRIEDFTDHPLQLVIDDPAQPERDSVRRILFCSGKVFYSLATAREKENVKGTALVRVEQLYPFPRKEIQAVLAKYRQAREICWVQEEPKNRGAWSFMEPRLRELLPDPAVLTYFGRDEGASPATGSYKMHQVEEQEIIGHALEIAGKDQPAAAGNNGGGAAASGAVQASTSAPATASTQTPVSD
jgi:2-oxoglutarate dehydrogenase E1 component